jgi:hypothetical protein
MPQASAIRGAVPRMTCTIARTTLCRHGSDRLRCRRVLLILTHQSWMMLKCEHLIARSEGVNSGVLANGQWRTVGAKFI